MNEVTSLLVDTVKMDFVEINNNLAARKSRKTSQVSNSSVSSCQSDSSEEGHGKLDKGTSIQEVIDKAEDKKIRTEYSRCRSNSDGAARKVRNDDSLFENFPNLPNSVLDRMGLRGLGQRERLSEEELEQKFTSLALAITIDAATIKDRCERLRRSRDQTETNLETEIGRLREKLALIQPLCIDYETVDLLSTLLSQVDKVVNASSLVSISAERYGSVQHEERLTDSVHIMISHVQMLKQQRDSARRQLQYTKRVLQNPVELSAGSPTTPPKTLVSPGSITKKITCRRRASIATISQPLPDKPLSDIRKVTRRTSELSLRASSLGRNIRPNRLELGGDLVKIKEGFPYDTCIDKDSNDIHNDENQSGEENGEADVKNSAHPSPDELESPMDIVALSLSEKIKYRLRKIEKDIQEKYNNWADNGTIHEVCCFCALLCFSISIITMVNILVEYEYAKRGRSTSYFFWASTRSPDDKDYSS